MARRPWASMPSYLDMGLLSDDLYSHIFNELEFRPFPWLRYEVYAAAPLASNTFTELTHSLLWQVHPAIELRLSHQYIDDLRIGGVSFTESQRVTASSYWRLNENWQFEPMRELRGRRWCYRPGLHDRFTGTSRLGRPD
jgi:hypothetical protein